MYITTCFSRHFALCSHSLKRCSQRCSASSPTGISGERQRQFGEKDTGVRGWERWWKEKAAFQLKISPQFKGQLRAGWPQRSLLRAGLGCSTPHSGQAEPGPASFVHRGAPLWCISVWLPNHPLSFPAWLPISRQAQHVSLPPWVYR